MTRICRPRKRLIAFAGLLFAFATAATAATEPSTPPRPPAPAAMQGQTPAKQTFSQDELDALVAPVALYPDALLIQVLMASTYPLEVVHADRFLNQNPGLQGDARDDAVAKKNWDPSVQSLTAFPKVLAMMSDKLEWTEHLGNAVLEDETRVMDTVQSLRKHAEAAGNLKSTSEQTVVKEKETIYIEPSKTNYVYVPYYDYSVVYGTLAAAYYDYYERYYGSRSVNVSYSASYSASQSHWNWARADWNNRRFTMDTKGNRFWDQAGRAHPASGAAWQHDAMHRPGAQGAAGNIPHGSPLDPGARGAPVDAGAPRGTPPMPDRGMQGRLPMAGEGPPNLGSFGGFPGGGFPGGGFPGGGGPPPMPGPPPGPPGPH